MAGPDRPDTHVQRLIETVNSIGVKLECPSCGHAEWAPLGTTVALPTSGLQSGFETQEAECLALACKRCGFVRLHSAQVLEES
jgi:predicted nucleic-acid-binding Zn-ribbon protein